MKQYFRKRTIDITITQDETLYKLKNKYKVKVSHFIRQAITEKLQRDYRSIIESIKEPEYPF